MTSYIVRRLVLAALTMLGVSFILFAAVRMIPGDVVDFLLSQSGRGGGYTHVESIEDFREQLGIDGPLPVQYARWAGGVIRGDFGTSLISGDEVGENIKRFLPVSLELGFLSILTTLLIGVPVGIISAIRQDSLLDYFLRSLTIGMLSIPGYWLATLLIVFGAVWWNWSPPITYIPFVDAPLDNLRQFIVPAFILGITGSGAAAVTRLTRTAMLETLREDYVRTARSKGLHENTVILRHVLRNAMLPVFTVVGLSLGYVVGGTVIFEQIFNLPGMGRYLFLSVNQRDYPAVQAVALIFSLFIVSANLLTDIVYALIDPRIKYS